MTKKIIFLMCLLMAMVWTAGCTCPGVRPVVAAPPVVIPPPPPASRPEVVKPVPVEEPIPSKKLKQRVFY
jgi:hypothetical protein